MSSNDAKGPPRPLFIRIYLAVIPAVCLILTVSATAAVVFASRKFELLPDTAETARSFWLTMAAIGGAETLGLAVSLLAVMFLTRAITRPVEKMAREALALTEPDGTGELSTDGRIHELRELSVAFNRLLDEQRRRQIEISNLSTNLLHDIKTPLAIMRNEAEAALLHDNDAEPALQSVCESCDSLLDAVAANAEIAALASGLNRHNADLVDIASEIDKAVDLYRFVADAKHQTLESRIERRGLLMSAHRIRIQQLISNLLDNAIKYTPAGGHIGIDARLDGPSIVFSVSDTGVGISAEDIPRIFQRFYRSDPSRHEQGFGLGLALVKAIVEFYHGEISVTSSPGNGSMFTVSLPASEN